MAKISAASVIADILLESACAEFEHDAPPFLQDDSSVLIDDIAQCCGDCSDAIDHVMCYFDHARTPLSLLPEAKIERVLDRCEFTSPTVRTSLMKLDFTLLIKYILIMNQTACLPGKSLRLTFIARLKRLVASGVPIGALAALERVAEAETALHDPGAHNDFAEALRLRCESLFYRGVAGFRVMASANATLFSHLTRAVNKDIADCTHLAGLSVVVGGLLDDLKRYEVDRQRNLPSPAVVCLSKCIKAALAATTLLKATDPALFCILRPLIAAELHDIVAQWRSAPGVDTATAEQQLLHCQFARYVDAATSAKANPQTRVSPLADPNCLLPDVGDVIARALLSSQARDLDDHASDCCTSTREKN